MKYQFIILSVLISTLLGCTSDDFEKDPIDCTTAVFEGDPILKNDPEEIAIVHYKTNSQIKWMGCCGYTKFLPGVPDRISYNDSDVHWIVGTSDALSGEAHGRYNDKAIRFAEIYNKKRVELNKHE